MKTFGLIGKSLVHSYSQSYFEEKFKKEGLSDCQYRLFELSSIEKLPELIASEPDLCGFNVTIPYKKSIVPFLDELSPEAAAIGAVNVVKLVHEVQEEKGENEVKRVNGIWLKGYNTDAEGFALSLEGVELPGKALVLGAGGAAAAVKYALQKMEITFLQVSRKGGGEQRLLAQLTDEDIRKHPFIVNCTPVGTAGNSEQLLDLPYDSITEKHFLYDLVYNPEVTPFLHEGKMRCARVQNGLKMLHLQAEAAWRIWSGLEK